MSSFWVKCCRFFVRAATPSVVFGACVLYAATVNAQRIDPHATTPGLRVAPKAHSAETAFYKQPVGLRIGRWYKDMRGGFPKAVSLAQAAIKAHDKTNARYVALARAQGNFAHQPDEDEALRRLFFPAWSKDLLKDKPDFWSVPTDNNPSVLGATHFRQGFKGFITLSQELPLPRLAATYDHELTHYLILSDKDGFTRRASLKCILAEGPLFDELVMTVFGERTDEAVEKVKYWLQPAEIDVALAEIKRRYVFWHNKCPGELDHRPGDAWEWWSSTGARQSRDSDEPASICDDPDRFRVLNLLPESLIRWLFKRMQEVV